MGESLKRALTREEVLVIYEKMSRTELEAERVFLDIAYKAQKNEGTLSSAKEAAFWLRLSVLNGLLGTT